MDAKKAAINAITNALNKAKCTKCSAVATIRKASLEAAKKTVIAAADIETAEAGLKAMIHARAGNFSSTAMIETQAFNLVLEIIKEAKRRAA